MHSSECIHAFVFDFILVVYVVCESWTAELWICQLIDTCVSVLLHRHSPYTSVFSCMHNSIGFGGKKGARIEALGD